METIDGDAASQIFRIGIDAANCGRQIKKEDARANG